MPRGDKSKYTDKQKRQAEHIEEGYMKDGDSREQAESKAWATVNKIHGEMSPPAPPSEEGEDPAEPVSRHVDGRQLCEGLREFALMNWGMLARTVLSRWNIRRTVDFGRIVFALVDNGHMQKTEEDTIEDFRDVYDFRTAFEADYRIEQKSK